ncbi:MAG TPA: amino acid adenylation domain-containing protein, partial [Pyrinomonadaceae bacterium]|nr:amino acid adenylation domain-containing protein [Pyrinomonadaceae bacterium]
GEPCQVISEGVEAPLVVDDLRDLAEPERAAAAQRLAAAEAGAAFALQRAPLVRARLLRLAADEQMLIVVFHHIVSDGWSLGVFVRELGALYEAYGSGQESPLPELELQYADYAQWQRERLREGRLGAELEYWRERLGGEQEPLALPTDRVRPSVPQFAGATQSWVLGGELTERLKELSRGQDATLFMTLLAGLQTLLWRYTGQEEISVGTPVAGRTRSETEGLIGFFVNTLVLRTNLRGAPSFVELLGRVREVCLGAYQHQELPFEQLVQALQPEREVSRTPLFQVMLVLQNMPLPPVELSGLKANILNIDSGESKFELSLYLRETEVGLTGIVEYQTALFDHDTINHLVDHLLRLLESVVRNPYTRISELEMLNHHERRQFIFDWNETRRDYAPSEACLHEVFEEQVRRNPDAIAITYDDEHLTYAELNRRANKLARLLRQKGVGFESRVGLLLQRSIDLVVSALAVIKAGAAYVPLDPAHSGERLSYCVKDAGAKVLVTSGGSALEHTFESWGVSDVIRLDASTWLNLEDLNSADLHLHMSVDSLAYVVYTSGSTGKPKGVLGLHRGTLNRFRWMWENYPFEADDVCCQKTSIVFVDFVWELFGPLLKGVRTVIMPDGLAGDPRRFVEELAATNVTRVVLVPSLLNGMLEAHDDLGARLSKLKLCVVSGEALPSLLAQRFSKQLPHSRLLNLYGSSEVSADVTCCEVSGQPTPAPNSIGRPIANTQIYLLDRHLQPIPRASWGELYAGGANLARGYCDRPDLTAEKFIPNPFSDVPGARMYRTGDLTRYLPDGQIEFRGRVDQQFKLRGFRIEPAEIEAALELHPQINEALVVLREEPPNEKRLAAYLVPSADSPPATVEQLRSHLRGHLPDYMVPSNFLWLEALPQTPTGKVDRQALLSAKGVRARFESTYVPPQTEVERAIVSIFQQILGVDRVGLNDNFFDLGGHSLLLVKLQNRLQQTFKRDVSLVQLIEHPTVGSLTRYFSNRTGEEFSVRDVQERLNKQWAALSRRKQLVQERKHAG